MKPAMLPHLVVCLITLTSFSLRAGNPGIAFSDPPVIPSTGTPWIYVYNGNLLICSGGPWDSLDGTWNSNNGSSEWDCSATSHSYATISGSSSL